MTEEVKNLIKKYEGCALRAYKCPAGVWTIGYGRTTNVKPNDTCTINQANRWFDEEYNHFKSEVKKLVKVILNENQLGALTSFAYNCGLGALKKSTLLKKINSNDFSGASNEFIKWNKINGKVSNGLTKRRLEEKALFLKPTENNLNLPYDVETVSKLNIRTAPSTKSDIIKTVMSGTVLRVWAECQNENLKWGKNNNQYFCLKYCRKI